MKRATITLVAVALAAGIAAAQPGPAGAGMTGAQGMPDQPATPGMMGMMANIPDLTPEQVDKFDAMRVAHMKTVMPIRTDIQVAEIEMEALWRADDPDARKVVAKVKEINDLRAKLELAQVNHRLDMYKLLTPEQKKGMKKMGMGRSRGMMRSMGRGRMGRGMMGMGQAGPTGQCSPQNCKDCMMH